MGWKWLHADLKIQINNRNCHADFGEQYKATVVYRALDFLLFQASDPDCSSILTVSMANECQAGKTLAFKGASILNADFGKN